MISGLFVITFRNTGKNRMRGKKEMSGIKQDYSHGFNMIHRLIENVFPEAERQISYWRRQASGIPEEALRLQALASIRHKTFHVQGGSAYALYPGTDPYGTVRFIAALQTVSDYLDNLCDRAGVRDEASFRRLHLSMLDAVNPLNHVRDYYRFYPHKDDGGYLDALVGACRSEVAKLPSYPMVQESITCFVRLYTDLQCYKHLANEVREEKLKAWAIPYLKEFPGISPWEFSAAAGSTLGIYVLFAAAFEPGLTETEVQSLKQAYFPWICGLHILLDYYIDAQEDALEDDLNFTSYYLNRKQCEERLRLFIEKALEQTSGLRYPKFHITIIQGLLAMYLSDPKVLAGGNKPASSRLASVGGCKAILYRKVCSLLRNHHRL